jgi:hypothetical protein
MLKQLSILLFFLYVGTAVAEVPKKVLQKAEKIMEKFYDSDEVSKEILTVSEALNKLTPSNFEAGNFFKIFVNDKHRGYGYIGNAPSKTATFDYLVLFDTNFIVVKSSVLIYREEYGGEIGSRRWLQQFDGTSSATPELVYRKDIIPISGATISVQSMTKAMNELLQSIGVLINQKAIR